MRFAMIGSYGHASVSLDSLPGLEDVELVAVARYGREDTLRYVGQHPAVPASVPVYDGWRVMLDEVRPDAVGVFTPLHLLGGTSIAAIERGCHVFSEKPLATTLEQLDILRRLVRTAGVQLTACFTTRMEPAFQAARQAVREGRIGRCILASGMKSYPFANRDDYYKQRRTYGGSIPWQAIHAPEFIAHVAGTDYTRVAAMHSNAAHPSHPGMEDNGGLLLELAGGGHAVVQFDYLRPWGTAPRTWGDDRLRIAGTEGVVEIVDQGRRAILLTPDAEEELPLPPRGDLFGSFVAAVQGRGESLAPTAESLRITEVALKARDAADEGRVIDLQHPEP